jgi:soluble lytic murein transglycosylase
MYKYAALGTHALSAVAMALGLASAPAAWAAPEDNSTVLEAREAFRVRDKARLLSARDALLAAHHPLAPWADYWYFQVRLMEAGPTEVDEFLARWPDSYVADRARNDWLLELGHRQDWRTFLRIQSSFKMNDDRDVTCLGVLARQQTRTPMEAPGDWREQARQAWWSQKDADFGCDAMAQALLGAGLLEPSDAWRKLRLVIEADKPRAVLQTARLLGDAVAKAVSKIMAQPQAWLMPSDRSAGMPLAADDRHHAPGASIEPDGGKTKAKSKGRKGKPRPTLAPIPLDIPAEAQGPLNLLAFIRWAAMDPSAAAAAISDPSTRGRWQWRAEEAAWAWAQLGRVSAQRLSPDAPQYFERALADRVVAAGTGELRGNGAQLAAIWSTDTLAWMARASVRSAVSGQSERWTLLEQAVDAMPPEQQQDSAWLYWKAKALQNRAKVPGAAVPAVNGDVVRQQARDLLARVANPLTFYGQLAAEELHGAPAKPPARPAASCP